MTEAYAPGLPGCKCQSGRAIEVDLPGYPILPNGPPRARNHDPGAATPARSDAECQQQEHCARLFLLAHAHGQSRSPVSKARDSEDTRGNQIVLPVVTCGDGLNRSTCFPK